MVGRAEGPQQELTYRIIGAAFAVHNELGFGFLESVYRKSLSAELRFLGIPHQLERSYDLFYRGVAVGVYRADLVAESTVVVEVKTGLTPDPAASVQLLNYLRASGIEVGLVIHFGLKVDVKRMIMSDAMKGVKESPLSSKHPR